MYYLNGKSTTQGVEAESTVMLGGGLALYLNGTKGSAIRINPSQHSSIDNNRSPISAEPMNKPIRRRYDVAMAVDLAIRASIYFASRADDVPATAAHIESIAQHIDTLAAGVSSNVDDMTATRRRFLLKAGG